MNVENEAIALQMAVKFICRPEIEGCRLTAYPDPKWSGIKRTKENYAQWGKPWTIGYGETLGITEGMVWTQEKADKVVVARVQGFLTAVLELCPQLAYEPPGRLAACTSLAYNIGLSAFAKSSVCRKTMEKDFVGASESFANWRLAGGKVLAGLVKRRKLESEMYMGKEV